MCPDRVSNLGPLAFESDALPTALRNPAKTIYYYKLHIRKGLERNQMLITFFSYILIITATTMIRLNFKSNATLI